ncbi:cilia- and flagella-associated protein 70-like [Phymastichus coffea]|uniref:cilia- and flagella-associated protein 70-like n=1 Tax=Phymastichus coffea TaxID=108790 RepID=UPI00273B9558|nr:cilia- and flagella-associated protein 70-like [Phymastichus coffea]
MAQKEISFASGDSEFTIVEEERVETEIEISISSIENIGRDSSLRIKFKIEHQDVVLGESQIINIDISNESESIEQASIIDFTVGLPYCAHDLSSIRPLVSTPVLITVFEVIENTVIPIKKNTRRKSKTVIEANPQQSPSSELRILGLCNVDLVPLVLGEISFKETLVLETPLYSWDNNGVAWENLPRISIVTSQDESDMMMKGVEFNIMNITVESIYNLPSCFTDYMDYKCGTVAFSNKIQDSCIVFEGGKWTDYHDVERTKTWKSLSKLDSRAKFSKYKVDCDYDCVKNDFKKQFNLQVKCYGNWRRIVYKCWPFEIMITEKGSDQLADGIIYQFYVDASQLLFPGRKITRVLAQLFTQSLFDMEEKTGLKNGIFNDEFTDESKNRRDKSECTKKEECIPLFTDNGEPVLILIELELFNPLYAARTLEEYTKAIEALKKTIRPKAPFYYYTPDIAHDQYMNCVKHLVDVIAENYRDELSHFKQFLHEKGKYVSIRSSLKNKIVNLLDQKFAIDSPDWYAVENQNLVSSCYIYLIEQMHIALNSKLDVRYAEELEERENIKDLWIRAEEACEFEDYEKADKLFVKIICDNQKNPDSWIIYATYLIRRHNIDEAIECCREAIKLNTRHKIALLFYGIILATREEYYDAEIFLMAVTQLYPLFAEGWAILHLFYVKIQYYPGIDVTLCITEECMRDRNRDGETMKILNEEPMVWTTALCKSDRVFLLTTCLLLKLSLYNFAELSLTQDICRNDKSIAFLYFSSANRYLQQSYSSVIECLEEAESVIGLEFSVAALLGHAHYKIGNIDQATSHYKSIDMMYERPENIHLVHLRLGYRMIELEEYEHARNVFLRACKHERTCKTWLGVGICYYFLEKFDECELSLMEANRIDCEDAEVWGYLCLLSIALQRHEEFTQCYRQMLKVSIRYYFFLFFRKEWERDRHVHHGNINDSLCRNRTASEMTNCGSL